MIQTGLLCQAAKKTKVLLLEPPFSEVLCVLQAKMASITLIEFLTKGKSLLMLPPNQSMSNQRTSLLTCLHQAVQAKGQSLPQQQPRNQRRRQVVAFLTWER